MAVRNLLRVTEGEQSVAIAGGRSPGKPEFLGNRLDNLPGVPYDAYNYVTFSHLP